MRLATALLVALAAAIAPRAHAQKDQGLEIFIRPDKGYFIACHKVPAQAGPATRSNLGPALAGARMRELGSSRLHELLRDPTPANPDTVMPPFGKHHILEEREIDRVTEDLLARP